jgi:hypothetical protein
VLATLLVLHKFGLVLDLGLLLLLHVPQQHGQHLCHCLAHRSNGAVSQKVAEPIQGQHAQAANGGILAPLQMIAHLIFEIGLRCEGD